MAKSRRKSIHFPVSGFLLAILVVLLLSATTYLLGKTNSLSNKLITTPNPTVIATTIPRATPPIIKQQPLSEKDQAYQILLQHSSFTCPNVTDMGNWLRSVFGSIVPSNASTLLRSKNELLWACFVYHAQEYQSQLDILNAQPVPQPQPTQAYHYACNGFMCEKVSGAGSDTCSSQDIIQSIVHGGTYIDFDQSCGHPECQNNACVLVSGYSATWGCIGDWDCNK
jgi:hypothetical protein